MRRIAVGILTLFILVAITIVSLNFASAQETGQPSKQEQPVLKIMQIAETVNTEQTVDTAEAEAERRIWNSFVENFDYQWEILNATAQRNASNESIRDAMVATAAILVLNSQALAEAESITPKEEYRDFHDYTINSMKYFNIYLYNMAKLYETRKAKYSVAGREALNQSVSYYNQGRTEAEFLFD